MWNGMAQHHNININQYKILLHRFTQQSAEVSGIIYPNLKLKFVYQILLFFCQLPHLSGQYIKTKIK